MTQKRSAGGLGLCARHGNDAVRVANKRAQHSEQRLAVTHERSAQQLVGVIRRH